MIGDKLQKLIEDQVPGRSLARAFYCDPDIYQAEINQIFFKHWLFVGHVSQIPNTGDYVLIEFDTESVIVVRTKDGTVKAHMNVCRHRGSHICIAKQGSQKLFTCPYHAWSYDLDGKLVSAGQMPDNFDPADNSLHAVHVDVVGGLVFVSLAKDPLSLAPMKESLRGIFDILDFENLKIAAQRSYAIPANWKLAVENYQECYHCAPSHREFAKVHAMARPQTAFAVEKAKFAKQHPKNGLMQGFNAYFDLADTGAEGYQYDRNPLNEGCVSGSKDGMLLGPLLGTLTQYTGGASELMIGPLMYFLIYDDHVVGYRFLPVSQQECICDIYWFVREDARAGIDYDVEALTWLWDVTTKADKDIITNNQKGVNSRCYSPGKLSDMEHFLQSFLRWYLGSLTAP